MLPLQLRPTPKVQARLRLAAGTPPPLAAVRSARGERRRRMRGTPEPEGRPARPVWIKAELHRVRTNPPRNHDPQWVTSPDDPQWVTSPDATVVTSPDDPQALFDEVRVTLTLEDRSLRWNGALILDGVSTELSAELGSHGAFLQFCADQPASRHRISLGRAPCRSSVIPCASRSKLAATTTSSCSAKRDVRGSPDARDRHCMRPWARTLSP